MKVLLHNVRLILQPIAAKTSLLIITSMFALTTAPAQSSDLGPNSVAASKTFDQVEEETRKIARAVSENQDKVHILQNQKKEEIERKTSLSESTPIKTTSQTAEARVRAYFADIPIMIDVAYCESRFRQFYKGNVLRGRVNSGDVGVMQINEGYHLKTAERLGYDIETLEGNLAYARDLYNRQGVQPWSASAPCWKNGGAELAQK